MVKGVCPRMRVIFVLVALFVFMFSNNTRASVINTHHDFTTSGWTNGRACVVCHTPHNADTTVSQAPLWNHDVTTNAFTVYNSSTLNATVGQPTGLSRLCLSCHDGTIALDAFGGSTGSGTSFIRTQTSRNVPIAIGSALNRHHPISFQYTGALAASDGGLYDPNTTSSGLGGTIASDMLFGGMMECSSCHDVHVSRGTGSCSDCHDFTYPSYYLNTKSLVKSNTGSALCLTCHRK